MIFSAVVSVCLIITELPRIVVSNWSVRAFKSLIIPMIAKLYMSSLVSLFRHGSLASSFSENKLRGVKY